MRTTTVSASGQIALIMIGAICSGCSVLGLAVDASGQPDTLVADLSTGTYAGKNVLITQRDGAVYSAECRRVGELPREIYRSRYAQWQKTQAGREFPISLGDTLKVLQRDGRITVGSLIGIARESISVFPLASAIGPFRKPPEVVGIPIETVDSLQTLHGQSLPVWKLQVWLDQKELPTTEAVLLRRWDTSVWVPMDGIVSISEIRYSYQWLKAGAIVDGIGLAGILVYFALKVH
jgi:hypothetical protein